MVAVAEVGDDQADFADFTRAHHMAHFAHHRVGGIAIVHSTGFARFRSYFDDFFALFDGHSHRLFAQYVEASLKKRLSNFEVCGVWRGHCNKVNAVIAAAFASEHFTPITVSTVSCNTERLRIGAAPFGVVIKRACGQCKVTVSLCAKAVCWADLAAFAAANHAPIEFLHRLVFPLKRV